MRGNGENQTNDVPTHLYTTDKLFVARAARGISLRNQSGEQGLSQHTAQFGAANQAA